jgi:hypothetical protein
MLAWLMIGGGIHGTYLAHLLTTAKGVSREQLRVLDPHPEPLARWNRLTANTGMAYLRSPAVHNLGLIADALDTFAASPAAWVYRTYREPYSRPGYALFQAHAHQIVREHGLADLWLQGSAQRLIKHSNGWQVETTAGALMAQRVLLAVGRTELNWPTWATALREQHPTAPLHHTFEDHFTLAALPSALHTVVIGGGSTAAQVACTLAESVAPTNGRVTRRVTLLLRHPIRLAHFDSDPCWNGPKCLSQFHHTTDYAARRAQIASGRHRGSMPPDVARLLDLHGTSGTLHRHEGEVQRAQVITGGMIELTLGTGGSLVADRVLLATGFVQSRPGGALVAQAIADYGLPCAPCGYPIVDKQLCWRDGLYVTGPLAELELGATAPNIRGARLAGERLPASEQ